ILYNPKNAIETAVAIETMPPQNVPLEVAKGTKRAIKNKTNSGATNKLTTFITTSIKFPSTLPIKTLNSIVKQPDNNDSILMFLRESMAGVWSFLNLFSMSSEITAETLFNPEERLDIAAESNPAII